MSKFVKDQHAFLTMMEVEDLKAIWYSLNVKSSKCVVTSVIYQINTPAPSETMNSVAGYHSVDRNRASKNPKQFSFESYQCKE